MNSKVFSVNDDNNNYIEKTGGKISSAQLVEPSIAVSQLIMEEGDHTYRDNYPERQAFRLPLVSINDYTINQATITNFYLDFSSFLPTMMVEFADLKNVFLTTAFPRDGSIMKLYIGGNGDELYYKPIRLDFVITNVQSIGKNPGQNLGSISRYRIQGSLSVPAGTRKESWSGGLSNARQELFNLAVYMGLGFATNFVTDYNIDSMNWVNTQNKNLLDFAKEVTSHACYSPYTFFTSFIDQYYVLNFVECHSLLSHGGKKTDTPAMIYSNHQQFGRPDDTSDETNKEKKTTNEIYVSENDDDLNNPTQRVSYYFITNNAFYTGWSNYIQEYSEINDGFVSMSDGYRKHLIYTDENIGDWGGKNYQFSIFPLDNLKRDANSQRISDIPEKPVQDTYIPLNLAHVNNPEYVTTETNSVDNMCSSDSTINLGQVDTSNTYKLYYFAQVQNEYQMRCLKKCGLKVKLQNYNPAISKFSRIWVDIYDTNVNSIGKMTKLEESTSFSDTYNEMIRRKNDNIISFEGEDGETKNPHRALYNRSLSGWYVVTEMKIVYNPKTKNLQTELVLNRIEYKPSMMTEYDVARAAINKYSNENTETCEFKLLENT